MTTPLQNRHSGFSNASRKFHVICCASNACAAFASSKSRRCMQSSFMGSTRSKDVGQRRLDQTCSHGTERHEEDGCWTEQSAIDVVQVALLDDVVASRLAAAKLGGAPSVRHESARGHAGWTAWVAVVRIHKTRSARRYGSLQVMGPDARPMTNRLCRRKRTGERERRGQCDCREFHVFSVVVCKTTNGAFVRAEKVSRRRLPTNKSCSTGTIVHDGCSG
jgi:hypothetical protein